MAVVTESYRKGLDSLDRGSFEKADEKEKEGLLQVFNRGGFMKGYALGCEDAGVIFPGAVNHRGIRIGTVAGADGKLARVRLEKDLRNGDGLALRGGRDEAGMVYSGPDVPAGGTAVLRLRPDVKVKAGYEVYRLTDAAQMAAASALKGRTVPADLFLRAMPGEKLTLTATDGESYATVTGETVSAAKTRAATEEELVRNLKKTGDTVFVPREVKAETAGAFVPVSQVNAIRREALEQLAEERIRAFEAQNIKGSFSSACGSVQDDSLQEPAAIPPMAYVRNHGQAEAARKDGFRIVWRPEDYRAEALERLKAEMKPGDWLALPDVCEEDTLLALRRWTEENKDLLGGVALGSVGQLGLDWPVAYGAGPAIPVMNRQAAALLTEEGCAFVTASPELTGAELKRLNSEFCDRRYQRLSADSCSMASVTQIKDLDRCATIHNSELKPPIISVVYGRQRLMLLHHCPARTALGLTKGHRDCRMCDEGSPDALKGQALEDRKGYRFPLLRQRLPEGCMTELMNALPTDNINNSELKERGSGTAIVLTTENPDETEQVLNAFKEGRKVPGETTSGHWKRPVE